MAGILFMNKDLLHGNIDRRIGTVEFTVVFNAYTIDRSIRVPFSEANRKASSGEATRLEFKNVGHSTAV